VLWVPETHAAANEHRGHGASPTSCCRVPDSPRRSLYGSAHGAKFETRLRTSVPPCGGGTINPRSTPPRYSSRIGSERVRTLQASPKHERTRRNTIFTRKAHRMTRRSSNVFHYIFKLLS
ncbi:unnamed protein product, partial [Ixodes pacificus]